MKLAKDRKLANLVGHLMCKADQLRVRLNGTKGAEASGEEDDYRLCMTRHKDKLAWKMLGNNDY